MYKKIIETINSLPEVKEERKPILNELIHFIQELKDRNEVINLNFICTHNSRRSHLGQIWSQTLADFYKITTVNCYSGGTETTAMFNQIIETLKEQGFQIEAISESKNSIYNIKYSENSLPIIGFSKKYDNSFNPKTNFIAIVTCSSADEGCPIIVGAQKRISIQYNDPKVYDNTSQMKDKYLEKSLEIASEMNYVFSKIS